MQNFYKLKITLVDSKPEIYRILQVSGNIGLRKLNLYIQELFGFKGYHLYGFKQTPKGKWIGDINEFDRVSSRIRLDDYFRVPNGTIRRVIYYNYDFGDNWLFSIEPIATLQYRSEIGHPKCIGGNGNHLFEDIGGVGSLNLITSWCRSKSNYNYKLLAEHYGEDVVYNLKQQLANYDPDYFNPDEIILGKLKYIPPAE